MKLGRLAGALLASVLIWPGISACSQEPVVHKIAPRAANTLVMLPDGSTVHAELAKTNAEREFGLMERSALPQARGMLFVYDAPGQYPYWMYDCKIGLDILWLDSGHRIVEIAPDTPPCRGKANTCPSYGGHQSALYVLELPVGSVKAHHLALGQMVRFNLS